MRVMDLIAKLRRCNPESLVNIDTGEGWCGVDKVIVEDGKTAKPDVFIVSSDVTWLKGRPVE